MRSYFITAWNRDGIVVSLGSTVRGDNADPALVKAEALADMYPQHRFVVSNDKGRNLGSFEGDAFTYLGY